MGSLCLEEDKTRELNEQINLKVKMKGQYNNYKDFSNFEIDVSSKTLIVDDLYSIEGFLRDRKGKSIISGRITKENVFLQIRPNPNEKQNEREVLYEGFYNQAKRKYFGLFKHRTNTKISGQFWLEIIENNIWFETGITGRNVSKRSIFSDSTRSN